MSKKIAINGFGRIGRCILKSAIKNNIGLPDVSALIGKYVPESIIGIINKYSSGIVNTILQWAFVIIMIIFLSYIIKIFIHKKKI